LYKIQFYQSVFLYYLAYSVCVDILQVIFLKCTIVGLALKCHITIEFQYQPGLFLGKDTVFFKNIE